MNKAKNTYRIIVFFCCALSMCLITSNIQGQSANQIFDSLTIGKPIPEQLQALSNYAVGIRNADIFLGSSISTKALEIARKSGTQQSLARALYDMGAIYHLTERYDSAKIYYHQSRAMFMQINDRAGFSDTYINLGILYRKLSKMDAAFEWLEKATEIKRNLNDTASLLRCLNSLGNGYYTAGKYNKALHYYSEALLLNKYLHRPIIEIRLLNNIGALHETQNEFVSALKKYNEALRISDSLNLSSIKATILKNMGLVYIQINDSKKALDVLFESLYIRDSLHLNSAKANTLSLIGKVYEMEGNPQRANEIYIQSLQIEQEMGDMDGVATNLIFIGENLRCQGSYKNALSYFRKSLEIATQYDLKLDISENYRNLIHTYGSLNIEDSVTKYLEKYVELKKSFDIDFSDSELNAVETVNKEQAETLNNNLPTITANHNSILIGYFSIFIISGLIVLIFLLLAFLLNRQQIRKKFYRKIIKP